MSAATEASPISQPTAPPVSEAPRPPLGETQRLQKGGTENGNTKQRGFQNWLKRQYGKVEKAATIARAVKNKEITPLEGVFHLIANPEEAGRIEEDTESMITHNTDDTSSGPTDSDIWRAKAAEMREDNRVLKAYGEYAGAANGLKGTIDAIVNVSEAEKKEARDALKNLRLVFVRDHWNDPVVMWYALAQDGMLATAVNDVRQEVEGKNGASQVSNTSATPDTQPATGQGDQALKNAEEDEDTVDITEESIDSDLAEIFADKDVDHLEAALEGKYRAKKGEEFKLSRPAKKDAFEAAGFFSKIREIGQLTTEAVDLAKARRKYVRSLARQIAHEKDITDNDIDARIEKVRARNLQTQDEVVSARIEIETLEKAREFLAKGNITELSSTASEKLSTVVEERKKQMDLLQNQFNSTMKKIEGDNPDPRNTYLHYLRNLPDLIQQYPDAGRVLAEVSKNASNKKKLILMLIMLTLGALPIWDELKKMMQVQG